MERDFSNRSGNSRHRNDKERRKLREQRRRQIRFKKIGAASILFLMFAAACAVVFGIGFGIYKFVNSRKMVEEPYSEANSTRITLVDNVYGGKSFSEDQETEYGLAYDDSITDVSYASVGDSISQGYNNGGYAGDPEADNKGNNSEDTTVLSATEKYTEGSKQLIVVDAGHGGMDSGAVGENGLLEKNITLQIALFVREELIKRKYSVYMSRTDDVFVGLHERADKANELGADAFVSIHLNAFSGKETVSGVEALYYNRDRCAEYAQLFADRVSEATGFRNRGIVARQKLVVTYATTMPSTIIECGYITNKDEAEQLSTAEVQQKIASAIADALDEYFNNIQ
ncbi:MAG: N-acetylmuramoyl-L-alanine amidase [Lachnospiraceae bacterium]|nr:N-acetylmuramoyl-L-alanine amidase [Lachnospiraceae bacterium]